MELVEDKVVIVGVTGASGAVLAQTALRMLDADPRVARIHLVITETGIRLLEHELQISGPLAELPERILVLLARRERLLRRRPARAQSPLPGFS